MPDGSNLIVAGRTRHQIALADKNCKAVKVTLIDYDPAIHTDEWVQMANAGEHIINRTATTEHFRTYFTHNPITHAQAIEQGLVPIDPKTGQPSPAYIKGRQLAEEHLAEQALRQQEEEAKAAAAAKAKAEKSLPGQTKWSTPTKKAKPLSDSETKQTLISVAGKTVSKDKNRYKLNGVITQRKDGTEYTVATDGRRMSVISQPTYKPDTERGKEEFHSAKGEPIKIDGMYPEWRQVMPSSFVAETTIDLSYYSFLSNGSTKNFSIDPSEARSKQEKRIATPLFQDGQLIAVKVPDGYVTFDPLYFRDAYRQMVELGKKLGFSPVVTHICPKVYPNSRINCL